MTNRPIPVRPVRGPSPGESLMRAAFASYVARAGGPGRDRLEVCEQMFGDEVAAGILQRAAVAGATTGTTSWAKELVVDATGDFLASLAPLSAVASLFPLGLRVSTDNGKIVLPVRDGTPAVLGWVGEGAPIPATARSVAKVEIGHPRKVAAIVLISIELARRSHAQAVFTQLLREDAAATLDQAYFSTETGSETIHRGLLAGVTPLTADAGTDADAMKADLKALAQAVATNGSGKVAFVMAPVRAVGVPILMPELDVMILPSAAVPADRVIAVDPVSILHGTGGDPEIETANDATIVLNDAAGHVGTAGSPNVVAAPTHATFQTAEVATRVIMDVAFGPRRSGAIAYVDDASW